MIKTLVLATCCPKGQSLVVDSKMRIEFYEEEEMSVLSPTRVKKGTTKNRESRREIVLKLKDVPE
jgi:hypothetical protein